MVVLHLAYVAEWERAEQSGVYLASTRGRSFDDEGFVHCSSAEQLKRVAAVYRPDDAPLVVLEIDADRARSEGFKVLMEDGGKGEFFPHIYGPLLTSWVLEARPAYFDERGILQW